jgi:hypothetical protein
MESDIAGRLARLRNKVARLRELDTACALFGATAHGYRLGTVLEEAELVRFERRLGVNLPTEYRQFLTEVGHGGAGPYYGLFPLDGSDSEHITEPEQIRKPFRWTEGLNPAEWDDPCAQEDVWCDEDVDEGEDPQVILKVPGALYICNYGCALRFFLVVNGLSLGEVWMDRQADDEGLHPVCGKDGRRLGFLDWYEGWLDEGISSIGRG